LVLGSLYLLEGKWFAGGIDIALCALNVYCVFLNQKVFNPEK
jgi:hypothetical protein